MLFPEPAQYNSLIVSVLVCTKYLLMMIFAPAGAMPCWLQSRPSPVAALGDSRLLMGLAVALGAA